MMKEKALTRYTIYSVKMHKYIYRERSVELFVRESKLTKLVMFGY